MDKLHIEIDSSRQVFFTSDLHFGHRNILNFCSRPFADIKEMGQALIDTWNKTVGENDIVFVLGDMFWWDSRHGTWKALKKLNGEIYIVLGNHDTAKQYEIALQQAPDKIHLLSDTVTVWFEDKTPGNWVLPRRVVEVFLCHYPLLTWPHREKRALQLFGHIHSGPRVDRPGGMDLDLPLWWYQRDIGCDSREDYTPWNLMEILQKTGWPDADPSMHHISGSYPK